ncbi:MAG TPA: alpha/beta hydrolase, partial [Pseudonocardia sp.]|nr:alpha/beta hydrolase [Pseudonocardia sp.]
MERPVLRADGADNVRLLAVSFGVTVVGTRLYLSLAGLAADRGGDYHIAHALWGGLLLLVGGVSTLLWSNARVPRATALCVGVGCGPSSTRSASSSPRATTTSPLAAPIIYATATGPDSSPSRDGIEDVTVHHVEHGSGVPLVGLHGAGVDHREVEAAVEAVVPAGYRRIYPDLPGMGRSSAEGLNGNDDVVRRLGDFLERLATGPVLLLGHSYGAYLARGVAARRPDAVRGLALLCPAAERSRNVPEHQVVHQDAEAYDELEPEQRA